MNQVTGGNYFNKYESKNPLVRLMSNGFIRDLCHLVADTGASVVHEVGCGEGYLSTALSGPGRRVFGSDVCAKTIEDARKNAERDGTDVIFKRAGIDDLTMPEDAAQLIVCCEVLEHLTDPAEAVRRLTEFADPFMIFSVPREPIWRILNLSRLRYVRELGNTPGHIHHWSAGGFISGFPATQRLSG